MSETKQKLQYVLITPARNEETHIGNTMCCVIAQTVRPMKWIIVSDGSTDRTDDIVQTHAARHSWIQLVRMPEHSDRQFASKVHCFNAGYKQLAQLQFDIVGNLDADLTFDEDYMQYLLDKFSQDEGLGVAGTPFIEGNTVAYNYRLSNIEHVSGACQLFRRKCFEDVGGFTPVKIGGEDRIAVTTARMLGWRTRTFTQKQLIHHRPMGTAGTGAMKAIFRNAYGDYLMGNHPLWQCFRAAYQMGRKPYIVGGMLFLLGYLYAFASREPMPISAELIAFCRREQMRRLRSALRELLGRTRDGSNAEPKS